MNSGPAPRPEAARVLAERVDHYLVVRDNTGELRVVGKNGAAVDWRRVSNVFRGPAHLVAKSVVTECLDTVLAVTASDGATAKPVRRPPGVGTGAAAVLYSEQNSDATMWMHVGSWEWRSVQADLPPVLHLSQDSLDLLGVAQDHRDRNIYGPADLFSRTHDLGGIVAQMAFVCEAVPGETRSARALIKNDDGNTRSMCVAEQSIAIDGQRSVRGLMWETAGTTPGETASDSLNMNLATVLATNSDQFVAIGDARFPLAPIVLKWVTPHPPGIGHGASTGQTPGFHPDDVGRVIEYVRLVSERAPDNAPPTLNGIRLRRAGGGWMRGEARAFLIDPEHFPTIWVALLLITGTAD